MEIDLSLVGSDALTAELLRRFDCAIIALLRKQTDTGQADQFEIATAWTGGPLLCLGVAEVLKQKLVVAFAE